MEAWASAICDAADAIAAELPRFVAASARDVHDSIPTLPSDPRSLAGTRHSVQDGCLGLLGAFRAVAQGGGDAEPLRRELAGAPLEVLMPHVARAVRRLAHTDTPLVEAIAIVQIIHRGFLSRWDATLSQQPAEPGVLLEAARRSRRLSFVWADAMVQKVIEVFEAEAERLAGSSESRRMAILEALLGNAAHGELAPLSRQLGYDLSAQHLGLVLWNAEAAGEVDLHRAADALALGLGAGSARLLIPVTPSLVQVWLGFAAPPDPAALATLGGARLPAGVSLALAGPASGPAGFRRVHRQADDAFRFALSTRAPPGAVIRHDRIRLAALLGDDPERLARFTRHQLGELAEPGAEAARLRRTLAVFLDEHRSRQAAAERLHIHANTVGNRVRTALETLGDDLGGRPSECHVALALTELLGPDRAG
jgi:hypothetical protein